MRRDAMGEFPSSYKKNRIFIRCYNEEKAIRKLPKKWKRRFYKVKTIEARISLWNLATTMANGNSSKPENYKEKSTTKSPWPSSFAVALKQLIPIESAHDHLEIWSPRVWKVLQTIVRSFKKLSQDELANTSNMGCKTKGMLMERACKEDNI